MELALLIESFAHTVMLWKPSDGMLIVPVHELPVIEQLVVFAPASTEYLEQFKPAMLSENVKLKRSELVVEFCGRDIVIVGGVVSMVKVMDVLFLLPAVSFM
jgi:hypothetical protein